MPTRLAGEAICHTWAVFCPFQTFCRNFCAKNAFSKSAFRMLAKILTSSQKKLPRNGAECEKRFLKKRFLAQKRVQKNFCQFCPRRPPTPPTQVPLHTRRRYCAPVPRFCTERCFEGRSREAACLEALFRVGAASAKRSSQKMLSGATLF